MVVQPRHRRGDVTAGGGGAEQRVLDAVAARRRRTPEVGHLQARRQHADTRTDAACDVTCTLTTKSAQSQPMTHMQRIYSLRASI